MIKHVIFDLGNVIVEVHPERTMREFAVRCGLPEEKIRTFYLSQLHLDFMAGKYRPGDFFTQMMRQFPCPIDENEFRRIWNRVIGEPKNGIASLISDLKNRYVLSICSNTDPWHWEEALRKCPFLTDFEHYFLSFEMKRNKPDPEIFRFILGVLQTTGPECVFVDDTLENIQTAEKLGIHGVHAEDVATIRKKFVELGILS